MEAKCLYCYQKIDTTELKTDAGKAGFHQKCSKQFFGSTEPPLLDISQNEILDLAKQVVLSQKTVTGVQAKLSLSLNNEKNQPKKFTIVGLWGQYILKPQSTEYFMLPENEDVTMHLAQISKIKTVQHSLIKLKSGELAYITKRIDRKNEKKFHMEDMCQLSERLTEHKYKGSYEQVAKLIKKYTLNSGLDVTNYYETVIFSFLTGNNDMHLKNFSLLKIDNAYSLCPAYDLVASELVVEGDDEDMALNLNGKKKKIKKSDFETAMKGADLDKKVIDNIFNKYKKLIPKWLAFIDDSFLNDELKENYKNLILKKAEQIKL